MTPEAQRIAIATHCGWTQHGQYWKRKDFKKGDSLRMLPDYVNSLDAIHEAEKTLTVGQHYTFRCRLWEITDASTDRSFVAVNGEEHNRRYCSASADQRAQALLLALNLWDDSK